MPILKKSISVLLAVILFIGLVSCSKDIKSSGCETEMDGVKISLDDIGGEVNFHSEEQNAYLSYIESEKNYLDSEQTKYWSKSDIFDKLIHWSEDGSPLVYGAEEKSRPVGVKLVWNTISENTITSYEIKVSENKDMRDSLVFYSENTETVIYNLKRNTKYYWTVTAMFNGGKIMSGVAWFTTADKGPRNIFIDGVTNVRDLGGYKTEQGTRVNQGLLYRSGRLNVSNDKTPTLEITERGINAFFNELKVKCELDFRSDDESGNISKGYLGLNVRYYRIPMIFHGNIYDNGAEIKEIFNILSHEENYPLVFHCHIGTDRTGIIAFLINGLLGVSENDLYLDYIWSNFGDIDSERSAATIESYLRFVNRFDGEHLRDKIYTFLTSNLIGIESNVLDNLISIMTEKRI